MSDDEDEFLPVVTYPIIKRSALNRRDWEQQWPKQTLEANFDMARGRRRTKNLEPYARLNDYTQEHLVHMYNHLCLSSHVPIDQYINSKSELIHEILRKFMPAPINDAHYKFEKKGHKVYAIGRPDGSKNAPVNEDALQWLEDVEDQNYVSPELAGTAVTFVTYDEFENMYPQDPPKDRPGADPNDMSLYALKTELQDVAKNITNAVQKYCEDGFGKAFENIDDINSRMRSLGEAIQNIKDHRPTIVTLQRVDMPAVEMGLQHKHFPKLLKMCSAKMRNGMHMNVWLHGPAATSKSTSAESVAKALGLDFYTDGKLQDSFEVKGYRDGHGNYNTTQFRQAFENGGVYLADEIDGSMPDALLAFNSALANGFMAFPDKMVRRHPDFIFIAAANTTGTGATLEYVGRFKQDLAFTDRFVFLDWPLDTALEDALVADKPWLAVSRAVRGRLAASGIKGHLITMRASLYGEALLAAGMSIEETTEAVLRKGLSDDQWNRIK